MTVQNTPVGTTYPIPNLSQAPQGNQIAAGGGSIINTSALAAVLVAPVNAQNASPTQISTIQPGGAINWPSGIACWIWTETSTDAQVFVSPGLTQYEAGGLPWLGQGQFSGLWKNNVGSYAPSGNGIVLTDALLAVGNGGPLAGNDLVLLRAAGVVICYLSADNQVDHFDSARGLFCAVGGQAISIATSPDQNAAEFWVTLVYEQL